MRSSVKQIALILVAAFLFAIPLGSYGATTSGTAQFSDVIAENPFGQTILDMRSRGFVKGYPDGTFAPDNSISRAEFVTMVVAAVNPNPTGTKCFSDVIDDWYAKFVCTAKSKGWVVGYNDGTFKPHNNINFAEAATILNRAFNLKPGTAEATAMWYKPYVTTLAEKNAIPVSIDNPEKKISRAETTEIIWRLATNVTVKPTKTYDTLLQPLPQVTSCTELKEKVAILQYQEVKRNQFLYEGAEGGGGGAEGEMPAAAPDLSGAKEADTSAQSTGDYSQTNVQVEGVDEADVIKNDGDYVYMVSRNQLKIIKVTPPTGMQELVSSFDFSDNNFTPVEIFITPTKLIVTGATYRSDGSQNYYAGSRAEAVVIDISDRANPKEVRTLAFDGDVVSSRRIGNKVYLVTSMPQYYLPMNAAKDSVGKILPNYYDSKTQITKPLVTCSGVRIIPNPQSLDFLAVVGFDVNDASAAISKSVVLGGATGTVYASEKNLYVAHTKYAYPEVGIFDTLETPRPWMPIWGGAQNKTEVFRFSLDNGTVTYKDKGEVPGNVINQFAMDENGTTFRIVTHTDETYNPGAADTPIRARNDLFVLDRESLGTIKGKVENIAPGEVLHSVRFIGKRAYLVTFKQIDPFFVVDLTIPSSPKVLGELKIPGYSDYLHPYDDTHIIGFGKEVDPTIDADKVHSDDAVYYTAVQGLKIAMFDVADPQNPKALFKEVIGDQGTDSELLYNHRALLFDKSRGIFGFPVTVAEIKNKDEKPDPWATQGDIVFQGAYVYKVDLTNGFQLQGKITNLDNISEITDNYFYSWYEHAHAIKRLLYIGDYFYGVSPGRIKAVNRNSMQEVGKIDLNIPKEETPPPYQF